MVVIVIFLFIFAVDNVSEHIADGLIRQFLSFINLWPPTTP